MITSKAISGGILRAVGTIALFISGGYVLFQIKAVIIFLIISLILTLIGSRIKDFTIKHLKFNNLMASMSPIIIYIIIILSFILMFVPLILAQAESLSILETSEIQKNFTLLMTKIDVYLEIYGLNSEKLLRQSNLISNADFRIIPNFLNFIIGTLSDFGIGLASTLFITFFLLKDKNHFTDAIKSLLPTQHKGKILNSIFKINHLLSRYFAGLILQQLVVFTLYLIVLAVFGVNSAVTIAFLCALLNIIPYIGPLIGTILAAILTMIDYLGTDFQTVNAPTTLYVIIGFILVHLIDSNISQPLIFSNSTKSHPLEIFLVILIAGFLTGITGMIVAIPLYTILKVTAKEFMPHNKIVQLLTQNL